MIMPLNATTFVPLVGEETWAAFVAQVNAHEAGMPSAFTELNRNTYARYVDLELAPEDLRAAASYAPADRAEVDAQRLAFRPMTMADIIEQFLRTHLPRATMGESIAPVQAAMLGRMKPGLLEAMGMDRVPAEDPRRKIGRASCR